MPYAAAQLEHLRSDSVKHSTALRFSDLPPGVGNSQAVGPGAKAVALGLEPMSREEASLFFRLVADRHGCDAVLITANTSVREWTELLAWDEALTNA